MYLPYYIDPTYVLVIIGLVITLAASAKVKTTFANLRNVEGDRCKPGDLGLRIGRLVKAQLAAQGRDAHYRYQRRQGQLCKFGNKMQCAGIHRPAVKACGQPFRDVCDNEQAEQNLKISFPQPRYEAVALDSEYHYEHGKCTDKYNCSVVCQVDLSPDFVAVFFLL